MYEMSSQVPFTQCGAGGLLKLHSAVSMMMDCCQFQEYQEKGFKQFLIDNDLAIFLFSIQIDILRLPAFREHVKTAVRIYDCRPIYGLRRITMRDEAGKLCLISNAAGAFFRISEGRAAKLDAANLPLVYDPAEEMECLPRKIPVPRENGAVQESCRVQASQLDPNGHLTSHYYFSIAQDALAKDFSFNRVRIEYKNQVKLGESVTPVRYTEADRVVVDMRNANGLSAAVAEFTTADLSRERDN